MSERGRSPWPYIGSVLQEEVEERKGDQPEEAIIERQNQRPPRRHGPRVWVVEERRAPAGDAQEHRHEQRQRHQRAEQVARLRPHRERSDERTDYADAEVAERERTEQSRQSLPERRLEQEDREGWYDDELDDRHVADQHHELRAQERPTLGGRHQERVEPTLLGVGDIDAVDREQRRE